MSMFDRLAFAAPVHDLAYADDWVPCPAPASMYGVFAFARESRCFDLIQLTEDVEEAEESAREEHIKLAREFGFE